MIVTLTRGNRTVILAGQNWSFTEKKSRDVPPEVVEACKRINAKAQKEVFIIGAPTSTTKAKPEIKPDQIPVKADTAPPVEKPPDVSPALPVETPAVPPQPSWITEALSKFEQASMLEC